MAQFYNANRDRKQPVLHPRDFNPMLEREKPMVIDRKEAHSLFAQLTEGFRR